jgi:hypothetical protein
VAVDGKTLRGTGQHVTGTSMLARTVRVSQPGADGSGQGVRVRTGEGPADRSLGRQHPADGGIAAGAERGTNRLRRVRRPLCDLINR